MNVLKQIGLGLLLIGILIDALISIGFNPPHLGLLPNLTDAQLFGILGVLLAVVGLFFYIERARHR